MVLTLNNATLTVELVDPRQDAHLLGARYCHGGYIFQVTDIDHGELLGTPARPYNVFDGQGIPDAFNLSPLREAGETTTPSDSTTALIIGVGLCDTSVTPRDVTSDPSAPTGVLDAAEWTVEPAYDTLYNVADGRVRTPQPTVTPDEAAPVRPFGPPAPAPIHFPSPPSSLHSRRHALDQGARIALCGVNQLRGDTPAAHLIALLHSAASLDECHSMDSA